MSTPKATSAGRAEPDAEAGSPSATPHGAAFLALQNICVAYRGKRVVHDVSLDVAAGEVIALIGPSGAGKSSLLRSINFLERPEQGTVTLDGLQVGSPGTGRMPRSAQAGLQALRRDVGMVFQQFNLFPHLSALENVVLGQVYALKRDRATAVTRARQELEHVGLGLHADSRPAACSGGQQQRIAIARALAMDPKIMLFDEPTSSLDPELGLEVLATMRRLASEGMTMIVVTHEMHFAEDVADRVVFMADGRVVEQGPPAQIMRTPSHARTRSFLTAVLDR